MGKLFVGAMMVMAVEVSFVSGMLALMYFEGVSPETAHKAIDEVHAAIKGKEA